MLLEENAYTIQGKIIVSKYKKIGCKRRQLCFELRINYG